QDAIEEIAWVAALKPTNIGVPAFHDGIRDYAEIAVVAMRVRERRKTARLIELLHRAIPYPLLLATQLPVDDGEGADDRAAVLSLAHQRRSLNEAAAVVVEEVVQTQPLCLDQPSEVEAAFLASLRIAEL